VTNPNGTEVVEVVEQEVDVYYPKIEYCPACGSTSIQREERAMERVYHFNRYYCQDCGCPFKALQKWQKEKMELAVGRIKEEDSEKK